MSTELIKESREKALEKLTADEHIALSRHEQANKPCLSPDFSAKLYSLFLRGLSCSDIVGINPGLTLGQVIKARVDGDWDQKREEYLTELLVSSNEKLQQTAAESLDFLSLLLAVCHKQQGEKLKKYLATGNSDELGGLQITNMKGYAQVIETLARLIGADQKKTVTHKFIKGADGNNEGESGNGLMSALGTTKLSPQKADQIRKIMFEEDED